MACFSRIQMRSIMLQLTLSLKPLLISNLSIHLSPPFSHSCFCWENQVICSVEFSIVWILVIISMRYTALIRITVYGNTIQYSYFPRQSEKNLFLIKTTSNMKLPQTFLPENAIRRCSSVPQPLSLSLCE